MRGVQHYLSLFGDTETVGAPLLAEAIYTARHDAADSLQEVREAVSEIQRDLPELTPADDATQRILVEAARAGLAPDDPRHPGTQALADKVGVSAAAVRYWLSGDRELSGPARKMVERIAGVD